MVGAPHFLLPAGLPFCRRTPGHRGSHPGTRHQPLQVAPLHLTGGDGSRGTRLNGEGRQTARVRLRIPQDGFDRHTKQQGPVPQEDRELWEQAVDEYRALEKAAKQPNRREAGAGADETCALAVTLVRRPWAVRNPRRQDRPNLYSLKHPGLGPSPRPGAGSPAETPLSPLRICWPPGSHTAAGSPPEVKFKSANAT